MSDADSGESLWPGSEQGKDYRGTGMTRQQPGARRLAWRMLWLFPIALSLALLLGWLTWLSPYGYEAPAGLAVIDAEREHRVFVYGTLRQPLVRRLVTGQWIDTRAALLPGFEQQGLDLERSSGAQAEGEVFTVEPSVLARLDRYERLGIRYERVPATLANDEVAWVYLRLSAD